VHAQCTAQREHCRELPRTFTVGLFNLGDPKSNPEKKKTNFVHKCVCMCAEHIKNIAAESGE